MTLERTSASALIVSRRDSRYHPRREVDTVGPYTSLKRDPPHVLVLEVAAIAV
jgi:hypothetical protein